MAAKEEKAAAKAEKTEPKTVVKVETKTPTPAPPVEVSEAPAKDAKFQLVLKGAPAFWHTDGGAVVLANIIHSRTACEVELK